MRVLRKLHRSCAALSLALLAGARLCGADPAAAEPVQDQSFLDFSNGWANVGPVNRAQTFTVGVDGALAEIEVRVRRAEENAGDLLFGIWPTRDGLPVESESEALAQIVLPAAQVSPSFELVSFDLNSFGIEVAAGDVLAIVLRDPSGDGVGGSTYHWSSFLLSEGDSGLYPGGQLHCRLGNACSAQTWFEQPALDANFRTWVSVPEPGGLSRSAAVLLGLAALSARRRFATRR